MDIKQKLVSNSKTFCYSAKCRSHFRIRKSKSTEVTLLKML